MKATRAQSFVAAALVCTLTAVAGTPLTLPLAG